MSDTTAYKEMEKPEYALKQDEKAVAVPYEMDRFGIVYNKQLLQRYFKSNWSSVKSLAELKNFATLKKQPMRFRVINQIWVSMEHPPLRDWIAAPSAALTTNFHTFPCTTSIGTGAPQIFCLRSAGSTFRITRTSSTCIFRIQPFHRHNFPDSLPMTAVVSSS